MEEGEGGREGGKEGVREVRIRRDNQPTSPASGVSESSPIDGSSFKNRFKQYIKPHLEGSDQKQRWLLLGSSQHCGWCGRYVS